MKGLKYLTGIVTLASMLGTGAYAAEDKDAKIKEELGRLTQITYETNPQKKLEQDRAVKVALYILADKTGDSNKTVTPEEVCNLGKKITEGEIYESLVDKLAGNSDGNADPDEVNKFNEASSQTYPLVKVMKEIAYDCQNKQ